MKNTSFDKVRAITGIGLFTAVVFVLQLLGSFIKFGPFSISLVLIPIVVGAAVYSYVGIGVGAWLGTVFGIAVLVSGDASAFLAVNPVGTVITVIAKGALAGLAVDILNKLLEKRFIMIRVLICAAVCPIVNTGVFLIGCRLFFFDTIKTWAGGDDVFNYILTAFIGFNFLFEFLINIVLSPGIATIINIGLNSRKRR